VPLKSIPVPDLAIPARASEDYFTIWAQTEHGRERIESWNGTLPGLRYKRTFSRFEIQRFLRELLTTGTRLNRRVMNGQWWGFEVKEMMAIALLRSPSRRLRKRPLRMEVNNLFNRVKIKEFIKVVSGEISAILKEEVVNFDNNFPIVGNTSSGRPIFHLAPGHENYILKERLYDLGAVGYFDVEPGRTSNAPGMSALLSLPKELQVMIIKYLFKLGTDIHVILDRTSQTSAPPFRYNFFVFAPEDDVDGPPPRTRSSSEPGPIKNLFALAKTNAELRGLALEVFYGQNKFILGPFDEIAGETELELYHLGHWKQAIGAHSCAFLHTNVSFA
tara:strand:- start:4976 stop:5971 length:996 start_codon:yes stop_codon:yes gene_type:complete